jgi:hypothetical protein
MHSLFNLSVWLGIVMCIKNDNFTENFHYLPVYIIAIGLLWNWMVKLKIIKRNFYIYLVENMQIQFKMSFSNKYLKKKRKLCAKEHVNS